MEKIEGSLSWRQLLDGVACGAGIIAISVATGGLGTAAAIGLAKLYVCSWSC